MFDTQATARAIGEKFSSTVVAIGKFEGVHLGHQKIIDELLTAANAGGDRVGSVVLTFENHPLSVLKPESCPEPLMSPQQRIEALHALGVQEVLMVPFTRALAELDPVDFIDSFLVSSLRASHVIIGDDFRFGRNAAGDPELLRTEGVKKGFTVEVIDEVQDSAVGRVSSSLIRDSLRRGDVELAESLLGHPHRLRGVVVHGDARGRELGMPTANLGPASHNSSLEGMVPKEGVYAGFAVVPAGIFMAAISVGNNPTFTPDAEPRVEAHLLDFDADLYNQPIEILFKSHIRDNITFTSVPALVEQMFADLQRVRAVLS